jgi:hypothetical protein
MVHVHGFDLALEGKVAQKVGELIERELLKWAWHTDLSDNRHGGVSAVLPI